VSRKLYSRARPEFLPKDDDGITHFDYFQNMIFRSGYPTPGPGFLQKIQEWDAELRQAITENTAQFEEKEELKTLAKWAWFKKHYEQARAGMPGFFQEHEPRT
jgi:hypothetical protein